jgi:D-alanyl-D-alanine carboxypeptidase
MPSGDATLGQLAAMRSGIPSYTFNDEFQKRLFADPRHEWRPEQLVDLVGGEQPMFERGTMTFYPNTNLVVLGMADTFMPTDTTLPRPHARGYTLQGVEGHIPADATDWSPSRSWTAGGMISDLEDLLVWGEALGTGSGIPSPVTQAARLSSFGFAVPIDLGPDKTAPQTPARAYGLGLGLALDWVGTRVSCPASTPMFSTTSRKASPWW